jgi:hypothetical protein
LEATYVRYISKKKTENLSVASKDNGIEANGLKLKHTLMSREQKSVKVIAK